MEGGNKMFYNLQDLMNRANISQTELAKVIKISFTSIHYRFNGSCDWKLKEMLIAQEVLNKKLNATFTLDYIFKKE